MQRMDDYARKVAKKKYDNGLIYFRVDDWERAIYHFQESIKHLNLISVKYGDDTQQLADVYYYLGNTYLNTIQYKEAVKAYQSGAVFSQSLSNPSDYDHRTQIELHINRCDAYLFLNQPEQAYNCLLAASKAFKKIKVKNREEEEIIVNIDLNPFKFYEYYENITSSEKFLISKEHISHTETLQKFYHQDRFADKTRLQKNQPSYFSTALSLFQNRPPKKPTQSGEEAGVELVMF